MKNMNRLWLSIISGALFVGCSENNNEKQVEVFSESKPYTLEILKDRSYYQADKVVKRLDKKNVESYILKSIDEEGDDWYNVVSGAFSSDSAMQSFKLYLDTALNIKAGDAIDYTQLDSVARIPVKEAAVKETKRIVANHPDVPIDVKNVVRRYPGNDIFYLKNISIVSLNKDGIKSASGRHVDMPRGVTLDKLKSYGFTTFASVIYKDNLYGDEVTLQVLKYKESSTVQQAAFVPSSNPKRDEALDVCSLMADEVLETGKYQKEAKHEIEVKGSDLVGYKASFFVKDKGYRAYYFLTDQYGEYVYMMQTTKDDDSELMEFLADVGKSEGLDSYDEFYNSFYTIADDMIEKDVFIGYYVERLDYTYAKQRGYAKWANRMVGHWNTSVYFYNEKKGVWEYSIFDLLSKKKSEHVYKKLYRESQSKESERQIYGETGTALYDVRVNRYWDIVKYLQEISYSHGRYIIATSGSDYYSEDDLIERSEKLQFEIGGYNKSASSHSDETDSEEKQNI